MKKKKRRSTAAKYKVLGQQRPGSVSIVRLLLFLFGAVLSLALIFILFSSLLQINIIEIRGTQTLSQEDLQSALSISSQDHLFFVDSRRMKTDLKRMFPLIEEVEIGKEYFPNKLIISVEERMPVLSWHTGGGIFKVDDEGIVTGFDFDTVLPPVYAFGASPSPEQEIEETATDVSDEEIEGESEENSEQESGEDVSVSEEPPASFRILEAGDKVAEKEFIDYVLSVYRELPKSLETEILHIEEGEAGDMAVILANELRVYFSPQFTLDSEIDRLLDTLTESENQGKQIREYVDLRFEKVYFK